MKTRKQRIERIQDRRAARLYLKHWQLCESTDGGPDDYLKLEELTKKIEKLGYPNPNTITFDNDAQPLITWKTPNFDWNEWFEQEFDEEQ